MKFGINQWNKKAPAIIKWLTGVLLSVSMGVTGYSYFEKNDTMMQIGGACFLASCVIPKFFGIHEEEKKDE